MALYQLMPQPPAAPAGTPAMVLDTATGVIFPVGIIGNAESDAYAAWLAAGNTPDPAPASSAPDPTVTGNQWAFSLSDLALSSAWQTGVLKSKPSDQVRVGLIARDTPLRASDPLLIRVAANAGQDGAGNPLVSVPTVFAHAQGMPL